MMSNIEGRPHPLRLEALVVFAVCLCVYWPRIGTTGFSMTEAHRVIPGWEMRESGRWLLPTLFGQVYLRKPPGMPWAVAGSSWLLGESEFSARAVSAASATAMALVALVFGRRWFGARGGLAAGLATALTPLFWAPGRSAEIEALNNFFCHASVLLLLDIMIRPGAGKASRVGMGLLAGLAIAGAGLAKGPAGLAAIFATIPAACMALRSWRPARTAPIWIGTALAAGVLLSIFLAIKSAVTASGATPVLQSVSDFLWRADRLTPAGVAKVLVMPLAAVASALPAALGLLAALARQRPDEPHEDRLARCTATALAITCGLSLLVMVAAGVGNPRYAMPSLTFLPMLAGYVVRQAARGDRIARRTLLGRTWAWPALLLAGAVLFVVAIEPRKRASSGREAGIALSAVLTDGDEIVADSLIDTRPEVLLYARDAVRARGGDLRIRWIPGLASDPARASPGAIAVLRTDNGEAGQLTSARAGKEIARGRVHKFPFVAVRF